MTKSESRMTNRIVEALKRSENLETANIQSALRNPDPIVRSESSLVLSNASTLQRFNL